jgi:hypothetical protein
MTHANRALEKCVDINKVFVMSSCQRAAARPMRFLVSRDLKAQPASSTIGRVRRTHAV